MVNFNKERERIWYGIQIQLQLFILIKFHNFTFYIYFQIKPHSNQFLYHSMFYLNLALNYSFYQIQSHRDMKISLIDQDYDQSATRRLYLRLSRKQIGRYNNIETL